MGSSELVKILEEQVEPRRLQKIRQAGCHWSDACSASLQKFQLP